MEDAIYELANTIMQSNNSFDCSSIISAVCSVISLLAIIILIDLGCTERSVVPTIPFTFHIKKASPTKRIPHCFFPHYML